MKHANMKFYSLLCAMAILSLTLVGCAKSISQKASETAAERIIEQQTGGNADVDIDDGNVKVESNQGKMEAGENVALPADFPNDVYVIEGTIKVAVSDNESKGQSVSIETDKTVEEISSTYQEKLKANGWKITGTMSFGDSATVMAEKDDRTVSVIISKGESKNIVTLGVGKK